MIVHNKYRQYGGEDTVAEAEANLLRHYGVGVETVEFSNGEVGDGSLTKIKLASESCWSYKSFKTVKAACESFRPDVTHVHNFWMKATPAVHSASQRAGAATVQTLHNYRLLCPSANFFRDGKVCEDCLGKMPWRGVAHKCYQGSLGASASCAGMIVVNRILRTWDRCVDAFVALSSEARQKYVQGNFPEDRIFVKWNFGPSPGCIPGNPSESGICLYVGRLAPEKGVDTLIRAWALGQLSQRGKLVIIGAGPEETKLRDLASQLSLSPEAVQFLGSVPHSEIRNWLIRSRCVVQPAIWQEPFGLTALEAAAVGRPAVASRIGALPEIITDGYTGLICSAGNPDDLHLALARLFDNNELVDQLGKTAYEQYGKRFTPDYNFGRLMSIYRFAVERRGGKIPDVLKQFKPATSALSKEQV